MERLSWCESVTCLHALIIAACSACGSKQCMHCVVAPDLNLHGCAHLWAWSHKMALFVVKAQRIMCAL